MRFLQLAAASAAAVLALSTPALGQPQLPPVPGNAGIPQGPQAPTTWSAGPAPATVADNLAPIVKYLTVTNASTFSTTWAAIQAAHLDQYLANPSLAITFFAPTNEAWQKRLPTMTRPNYITVKDLFSEGKSFVMDPILKYHMMQSEYKYDELTDQTRLSTLSNLCSYAKDLKVSRPGDVTHLISGGGSEATLLNQGVVLGNSIVYAIDDVLLPSVVTVPLPHALETFTSGAQKLTPALQRNSGFLDSLQALVARQPLAPTAAPSAFQSAPAQQQAPAAAGNQGGAAPQGQASGGGGGGSGGVDGGVDAGAAATANNAAPAANAGGNSGPATSWDTGRRLI